MSEPEPRRSVRATKGQHQHRELEGAPAKTPKQRQTRKVGRNATAAARAAKAEAEAEEDGGGDNGNDNGDDDDGDDDDDEEEEDEEEEEEEEVIRCVCGATSQDEDSDVAWIACDKCGVWQHNVCMGISTFDEDIPDKYSCEQCDPDSHTTLLEGMERGEKPWEERQQRHESEKSERKRRRGGRKGGRKRISDPKSARAKKADSPPPEDGRKRKREDGQIAASKMRKLSEVGVADSKASPPATAVSNSPSERSEPKTRPESRASRVGSEPKLVPIMEPSSSSTRPTTLATSPPATSPATTTTPLPDSEDVNKSLSQLPDNRKGPASALFKSFVHALEEALKAGSLTPKDQATGVRALAIRLALDVERALHNVLATSKDYASQARTLAFNIKRNPELSLGLLKRTLSPAILAHMKTEQLASKELQKEIQGIREKVEKQSIRITTDAPPRTRHTHKGEELVEDDHFVAEEAPTVIRRASIREPPPAPSSATSKTAKTPTAVQHSPGTSEFDLGKVLSSVKSPAAGHVRRTSHSVAARVEDADVDRMLQGETEPESPPYSPKDDDDDDDVDDADVAWRGQFVMSTIANFPCVTKWAAGANLQKAIGMPWSDLFHTPQVGVVGRIEVDKALPYLCGLRYNTRADVVVASIEPSAPGYEAQFQNVVNYFVSKQRYGVLSTKGVGCIRDTYLIPVSVEEDQYPEFLLNLYDNIIPRQGRTRPVLLAVFVCLDAGSPAGQSRRSSADQTFSPTTPHPAQGSGAAGAPNGHSHSASTSTINTSHYTHNPLPPAITTGQSLAVQMLGSDLAASPTLSFILPNAPSMARQEWDTLRKVYEQDPKTRHDLNYLSTALAREAELAKGRAA